MPSVIFNIVIAKYLLMNFLFPAASACFLLRCQCCHLLFTIYDHYLVFFKTYLCSTDHIQIYAIWHFPVIIEVTPSHLMVMMRSCDPYLAELSLKCIHKPSAHTMC